MPSIASPQQAPFLVEARARIIVALDVPSRAEAERLIEELDGLATWFKIGLELWSAEGPGLARALAAAGRRVFADLKLHDIPETVARAAAAVASTGASLLTVHGPPSAIAQAAARAGEVSLLGVTVLTSMDEAEYRAAWAPGDERPMADVVRDRAASLMASGCRGLITSPREVGALRAAHPDALLVVPGIRPAGTAAGDQKRVATPGGAMAAGASLLVVGRPIRDADDRRAAFEAIAADIAASS